MSLREIIAKQLNSYPNFKKQARISYFEKLPLAQVHMDTMFWQPVESHEKIPILCLVDVATRYTGYFVQTRKSDNIRGFLETFLSQVSTHFDNVSKKTILVTDGAPEFKSVKGIIGGNTVTLHLSTGINKAVLAEVAIRKARAILRKVETLINIDNITGESTERIDRNNIDEVFDEIQKVINSKAKLRERKTVKGYVPPKFNLGDPVFALNFYKFYPHQMKASMVKSSYKLNWYYEPFRVSKSYNINGVYKYSLSPYTNLNKELKYYFYEDQLQLIDLAYASDYILAFVKFNKKK